MWWHLQKNLVSFLRINMHSFCSLKNKNLFTGKYMLPNLICFQNCCKKVNAKYNRLIKPPHRIQTRDAEREGCQLGAWRQYYIFRIPWTITWLWWEQIRWGEQIQIGLNITWLLNTLDDFLWCDLNKCASESGDSDQIALDIIVPVQMPFKQFVCFVLHLSPPVPPHCPDCLASLSLSPCGSQLHQKVPC